MDETLQMPTAPEKTDDLSEAAFAALVDAVTIARQYGIRTVSDLTERVVLAGHSAEDTAEAVSFWSEHVQERGEINLPSGPDW